MEDNTVHRELIDHDGSGSLSPIPKRKRKNSKKLMDAEEDKDYHKQHPEKITKQCPRCEKWVPKGSYTYHVAGHGETTFHCELCKKSFHVQSQLDRHLNLYTNNYCVVLMNTKTPAEKQEIKAWKQSRKNLDKSKGNRKRVPIRPTTPSIHPIPETQILQNEVQDNSNEDILSPDVESFAENSEIHYIDALSLDDVSQMKKDLEDAKGTIQQLKEELRLCNESLHKSESSFQSYEDKQMQLISENENLERQLREGIEQARPSYQIIESLTLENKELRELEGIVELKDTTIKNLEETIQDLTAKLNNKDGELTEAKRNLETGKMLTTTSNEVNRRLHDQLKEMQEKQNTQFLKSKHQHHHPSTKHDQNKYSTTTTNLKTSVERSQDTISYTLISNLDLEVDMLK